MKTIGVLFGVENSFPSALVEQINNRNPTGIQAEFVQTGAVNLNQAPRYAVILDRISHDIPFYRAFLKHAALNGTAVVNNPFWCSADDKFLNYALAARLGVAVPHTVLLPHKEYPNGTSEKSLRNLEFPLDWDSVLAAIGEHGFLKPIHGGGWHGNDTLWRTVHDLVDIALNYAAGGAPRPQPRPILTLVDAIVAGEDCGPLKPRPKPCGLLVWGEDPGMVDVTCATLMGFDWRRIPLLSHLCDAEARAFSSFRGDWEPADLVRRGGEQFAAPVGWAGAIEAERSRL